MLRLRRILSFDLLILRGQFIYCAAHQKTTNYKDLRSLDAFSRYGPLFLVHHYRYRGKLFPHSRTSCKQRILVFYSPWPFSFDCAAPKQNKKFTKYTYRERALYTWYIYLNTQSLDTFTFTVIIITCTAEALPFTDIVAAADLAFWLSVDSFDWAAVTPLPSTPVSSAAYVFT